MIKFNKIVFSSALLCVFVFSAFAQESSKAMREAGDLMSRGDLKGAIAVLDKTIEKRKDLFEAYRMRASLHLFSGNIAGAITDLDRAIEIKPEAALYAQRAEFKTFLRDSDGAIADFDYAIAHGYKTEKVYIGRATIKRNAGYLDGAITDYRIGIGLNPDSAQAHVGLASTLDQKGETEEAILLLQDFLDRYEQKRDGNLPKSKMESTGQSVVIKDEKSEKEKSQIYLQGQRMNTNITADTKEEAEKQLNKQERILNISLAYANLAQMLERKGDFDNALINVNKSISIFDGDFYPIGLRGKILLDKGDLQGALSDLNKAIGGMSNIPNQYADRGIVFLLLEKNAEAQKDFDKFLQLAPKGADTLNKRIEDAKQKMQENANQPK